MSSNGAVADWFDNLDFFGTKKSERAANQLATANEQQGENWQGASDAADAASGRAADSYARGQGYADQAQDWIQTGGQSGKLASQAGAQISGQAAGTARSAGLNAAQAAKIGGQQGASSYSDVYGKVYGQGMQGLSNLSGQELNSSAAQGGVAAAEHGNMNTATGQLYGTGTQQQQAGSSQTSGSISGLTNIVGALIASDETKKKNIKSSRHDLEKVFAKVKPYRFNYKEGNGQDDKDHLGVMAQDLEKTSLKGAVMDTPEGKKVDTGQLTMGNTAMIGELNEKLDKIMKYVKRGMK